MSRTLRWAFGVLLGLIGAVTGIVVLLVAGLLTGRGTFLADAGGHLLPHGLAASTGFSPAAAYLIVHTAFYVLAGVAAVNLTRLADRFPQVTAGLVLVMIIVELGFLVFSTETLAQHRIDRVAWGAFLVAHGVADLVFVLVLVRAHPKLLQDLREGYEM